MLGVIQRGADRSEQTCPPRLDGVECAGTDQCFDRAPVDDALVDAATEVEQIDEWAFVAGTDDRFDGRASRTLDATKAITNAPLINRLEAVGGCVNVRRQHLQAERQRVDVELTNLVGIVHHQREVRRHECRGMMRLEVRRLVRDQRVGRGVRLVEAVASEFFHVIEQLRRLGR